KSWVLRVVGLPPFVLTTDVANITHVLKNNFENYNKSGGFKLKMQGLLGDGIFNTDGQQWFSHRKTSASLFKLSEFKTNVLDIFNHDLDQVLAVLHTNAASSSTLDLQSLMHKFTLESIAQIAFGLKLGCITEERVAFAEDFDYCSACIR
ncbi:cytochrome P450, partial [Ochromonadaceae sp. CCMP2298]